MTYAVAIKPGAWHDINDSYQWYEDQKPGLGEEFLEEVRLKIRKLEFNPLVFQLVHRYFRQAPLNRFPFVIVYEIIHSEVIVYSVFHTRKSPRKKWKKS